MLLYKDVRATQWEKESIFNKWCWRIWFLFCFLFWPCCAACGSYFPNQGLNPRPLHWKCRVLTTGPPGKSPVLRNLNIHMQKNEFGPLPSPHTKINSKWITGLNVRPETIKLLEENIEEKLYDIGFGNDFLNMTPKAQATKAKIDKWHYIKLKTSVQ